MPSLSLDLSLGGRHHAFGAAANITKNILCACRCQIPTAISGLSSPFTGRRIYKASPEGNISRLQFSWAGFYINGSFGITNADAATVKAFLEYPMGTFTPILFNGNTTGIIPAGGFLTSDTLNANIPANAEFAVRTVHISGTAKNVAVIELPASSSSLSAGDGNAAADNGNSGTIAQTSGINTFGPAIITGDIAVKNARSYMLLGDSITFGQGDTSGVGEGRSSGYLARYMSPKYPYLKIAKMGMSASDFANLTAKISEITAVSKHTHYINAVGVNDLRLGRTEAQIFDNYQTLYGVQAGKNIAQITLTPRSASTDSYATTANQTPKTDGNYGNITAVNTAIRAGLANVNYVLEVADVAMSARNSNIWTAPPSATTDGTHPNSTKAASMAVALPVI